MGQIEVHPRVNQRHPDISNDDVITAWNNAIAMRYRNFDVPSHITAVGADQNGRMIEIIGVEKEDGTVLIYHAMRLTVKIALELGLI